MKQLELFKGETKVTKYKQVNFTPDDAEAAFERSTYAEGWMKVVFGPGVIKQSKDKDDQDVSPNWFGLSTTLTPLSNPDDPSSMVGRGITKWTGIPVEPDHWEAAVEAGKLPAEIDPEDPKAPSLEYWRNTLKNVYAKQTRELMSAAFGEDVVPSIPYKDKGVWKFGGEELDADTAKEQIAEAVNVATEKVVEMLENEDASAFEGCTAYAYCAMEEDKKTGEKRPAWKQFSNEHPIRNHKPVDLLTGAAIMSKPAKKAEEVTGGTRKSAAKKKTSSKKKAA